MRDSMLAVSNRLEEKPFGRPVDVVGDPANARRTVYGMVDRQSLPNLFRSFDFASPDQSAERRPSTTVPQQALFGMNAPFMIEQAKALAGRSDAAGTASGGRIAALYHNALGRAPAPTEIEAAARFLRADGTPPAGAAASRLSRWEQLAQVLLMTNEFLFVD